eukprot:COSAG01_NODE_61930_length_287_cov_0.792553_2_plen_23_part_01
MHVHGVARTGGQADRGGGDADII